MYNSGETPIRDGDKQAICVAQAAEEDAKQRSAKSVEGGITSDFIDKSGTLPGLSDFALCEEFELAVLPPIDMAKWIQLVRKVQDIRSVNVLSTAGYWRLGAIITVAVSQTTPFFDMLKQMPELERLELGNTKRRASGDYYWDLHSSLKPGVCQRTRIYLTLKKEDSTPLDQTSCAS